MNRWCRPVVDCLVLVVLGANLAVGASAIRTSLENVFRWGGPTIPAPMKQQIAIINTVVPDGAPLFYIRRDPELNVSRLWQRALYPHPVFLIATSEELHGPDYSRLKEQYSIRYAISVGTPPLDPPFIRAKPLGSMGADPAAIVGELAP